MNIIEKITGSKPGSYVIFYVNACPYCQNALALLRKSGVYYKGYDMDKISGGTAYVLNVLSQHAALTRFDKNHKTKPIIFWDRRFLGGYTELQNKLSRKN